MTKIVAVGDIHGRDVWKKIIEAEKPFDKIVLLGDYVDTHQDISGAEQLYNLLEIIDYKKQFPENVVLLVGNHDYQYWPTGLVGETYSGFQPGMYASFLQLFEEHKKLFQMCFEDEEGVIYSHAGFTETFVEQKIGTFSAKQVNDVFKYKPQSFKFYDFDRSGCGDDQRQSCIWVRPNSLYNDSIDRLQVVGHTSVEKINHPAKSERRGFYLIDCLEHRQYLVKEDKKFQIKQLPK